MPVTVRITVPEKNFTAENVIIRPTDWYEQAAHDYSILYIVVVLPLMCT